MYFNPLHGFYPTKCPTRQFLDRQPLGVRWVIVFNSPFMDCMEERDVRCPFLFSVLCLNYYEIFLILRKIELLMKTTTVALGPHFEDFIQASILSGRYNNASEVVRSGLRLLEDQEYASRLAALRYAIDEGEASGDYEDFDPVANLAELNARRNG